MVRLGRVLSGFLYDLAHLGQLIRREQGKAVGAVGARQELEQIPGAIGAVVDQQLTQRLVKTKSAPFPAIFFVPELQVSHPTTILKADEVNELGPAGVRVGPTRVIAVRFVRPVRSGGGVCCCKRGGEW